MFLKKILVFSFSISLLLAQGENMEKNVQKEITNGYNAPFRIEVEDSWNFFLSGSYIYWQVKEKGLEFARTVTSDNKTSIDNMDFDYRSGFKIAASSKFHHDKWNIFCEYTRLHQEHIAKASAPTGGYLVPFLLFFSDIDDPGTNNNATQAMDRWFFSYDMLDLLLDHSYCVGKNLIFKTSVGARGGWIDQKNLFKGSFANLIEGQSNIIQVESLARSSSWMIGPKIGIDASWKYGIFRLFSAGSVSLLYQHFSSSFKQQDYIVLQRDHLFSKDKIGYVTPNFDLTLGMGWRKKFMKDTWNVDLSLSYCFLYFFNQNVLRGLTDKTLYQIETKPSDLSLHGLTIALGFDF